MESISKYKFIIFSIVTVLVSYLFWIVAYIQNGTVKIFLNQIGDFIPALTAIGLSVFITQDKRKLKLSALTPIFAVFLCVFIVSIIYKDSFYSLKHPDFLMSNPIVIALVILTFVYFVYQFRVNKGSSAINCLMFIPKTKIIWYVLAIGLYPAMKFLSIALNLIIFPDEIVFPKYNILSIIPTFIFVTIFYAAIGQEMGFRGYALRKLQRQWMPFIATLFVGIVWSIWQIGYFVIEQNYSYEAIPAIVTFAFICSFYCTWFFNNTKGNILIQILFSASITTSGIFIPHTDVLIGFHIVFLFIVIVTGNFFEQR